jgi:hypothetical protein
MGKHKSTWQFAFESLTEDVSLTTNMLNVTFHVTHLNWLHINSLNIRQVLTSYSNFNVSCPHYNEDYGAENVRLGGLTHNV